MFDLRVATPAAEFTAKEIQWSDMVQAVDPKEIRIVPVSAYGFLVQLVSKNLHANGKEQYLTIKLSTKFKSSEIEPLKVAIDAINNASIYTGVNEGREWFRFSRKGQPNTITVSMDQLKELLMNKFTTA